MRTKIVLAALGIGAAAIVGTSVAPPAGADTSNNCQAVGGATVCAQGGPTNGAGRSAPGVGAPGAPGQGCTNQFGAYQNCNAH